MEEYVHQFCELSYQVPLYDESLFKDLFYFGLNSHIKAMFNKSLFSGGVYNGSLRGLMDYALLYAGSSFTVGRGGGRRHHAVNQDGHHACGSTTGVGASSWHTQVRSRARSVPGARRVRSRARSVPGARRVRSRARSVPGARRGRSRARSVPGVPRVRSRVCSAPRARRIRLPRAPAGSVRLSFVSAGSFRLTFVFAGSFRLTFVSAGSFRLTFVSAGSLRLTFVSAGSFQFSASRAPPRLSTSRIPPDVHAFLPGTCEEKTARQRIRAACDKRAHVGSMPACMPCRHHRESIRPSSSLNMISVPPRL